MTTITKTATQPRRSNTSSQQSPMTLAVMLVLLLCQIFVMSSAYSVQYPNGQHPMGSSVSHHHSHETFHGSVNAHDQHLQISFNATDSKAEVAERSIALTTDTGEHEHNNHSHTPSHLPIEPSFNSEFYQAGTINDADVLFSNHRFAPPNPPPYH